MAKFALKIAKIDRFSNLFRLFSRFTGRGTHRRQFLNDYIQKWEFSKKIKKFHFWSIFANFSHIYKVKITFFKKLVDGPPMSYFHFTFFWIHMLWGIPSQWRFFISSDLGQQVPQHDVCHYQTLLNYVTIWKRECSSKTFFPSTILGICYVGLGITLSYFHSFYRDILTC
jgi:hypothetical protein